MAKTGGVVESFPSGATKVTRKNSAAVTAGRLVEVSGTGSTVAHAAAASQKVVGVALEGADFAGSVSDTIAVATGGVFLLVASGAITAGDKVMADTGGKVKTVPAVDTTSLATLGTGLTNTRAIVGIALESIADTASGRVLLQNTGG